jgi:anti-sigma-K factor RskA
MQENHVTEQIPAYALDCLDAEEALEVSAHLAVCTLCRDELRVYQAASAQLSLAAPQVQPPTRLKARLLQAVQARSKRQNSGVVEFWLRLWRGLFARQSGPIWAGVSLVLMIALTASSLALWTQVKRNPANDFRLVKLSATSSAPGASGLMVITQEGETGTLVVDGLPPLDRTQQYQLWLIRDGKRTSGGVFSVIPGGYGSMVVDSPLPLTEYPSFGITVEPAGGSPAPTGKKVLGGNL